MTRTLPLKIEPIPGESLTSWLQAIANLHQSGVGALAPWLQRDELRRYSRDLDTNGLGSAAAKALAHGTGVSLEAVEATWLSVSKYRELTQLSSTSRRWLWPRATSSFCVMCLDDNGGRWLTAWRFPWWCVCPVHQIRLQRQCPGCGGAQRLRYMRPSFLPGDGWKCESPLSRGGRGDRRCGLDLRETPKIVEPLELASLVRELSVLLEPGETERAGSALSQLDELYSIAKLRNGTQAITLPPMDVAGYLLCALRDLASDERFAQAVLCRTSASTFTVNPVVTGVSPSTAARIVMVRDARMRTTERLRWRSPVDGSPPVDDLTSARSIWRSLPRALWPDWCLRLFPTCNADFETLRKLAPVAMCLIGSSNSMFEVSAGMCERGFVRRLGGIFSSFEPHVTTGVIHNLIQLRDQLLNSGSPIDYQRRRALFADGVPLSRQQWRMISRNGGIRSGGPHKLLLGELWLWEHLTGEPIMNFPGSYGGLVPIVVAYHAFLRGLTPESRNALLIHARSVLDNAGIAEPVEWSPPRSWVTGDTAGAEPAVIPMDPIVAMLRMGRSERDVASELGHDSNMVSYIVSRNPPALRRRETNGARRGRPLPTYATPEWIQAQRLERNLGLREIAATLNVSRKTLAAVLSEADYELNSGRQGIRVDYEWLREQYVANGRTLPDISRELGVTPRTIARVAKSFAIPLRDRGGASHASVVTEVSGVPDPLRSALKGQGAEQRVQRFQVMARCDWINESARILQISEGTLSLQLSHLERDVGGPLIRRAQHLYEKQELTTLGQLLLEQTDQHFGKPRNEGSPKRRVKRPPKRG